MGFELISDDEKIPALDFRPPSQIIERTAYMGSKMEAVGMCQGCKALLPIPDVVRFPDLQLYKGLCSDCAPHWKGPAAQVSYGRTLNKTERETVSEFLERVKT